jgi:U6 snRNA-associated Sm-like protein LSm7
VHIAKGFVLICGGCSDDEGNESTRDLGLIVARGTLLVLISPVDGSEEIANPFVQPEDE